jgi:GntR family transcriptional regulator
MTDSTEDTAEAGRPLVLGKDVNLTLPEMPPGNEMPLYERLKQQMSQAILMGEWPRGTVLPNEAVLAQSFGIAVGTVRRAMSDLVSEGLLTRRRKTGTVVTGRAPQHSLRFFYEYFRLHRADGTLTTSDSKVYRVEALPATAEQREQLQIVTGGIIRIHRTRTIGSRNVMHDKLVVAEERVPGLPRDPGRFPPLLYRHLLDHYGIRIAAVREQITADLATEEDLAILAIEGPAAMLTIRETGYDQAGVPTIMGWHRASTRDYTYINEIR